MSTTVLVVLKGDVYEVKKDAIKHAKRRLSTLKQKVRNAAKRLEEDSKAMIYHDKCEHRYEG